MPHSKPLLLMRQGICCLLFSDIQGEVGTSVFSLKSAVVDLEFLFIHLFIRSANTSKDVGIHVFMVYRA